MGLCSRCEGAVAEIRRRASESQRQTCKICGRADGFDFNLPDEIWRAVVPAEFASGVVCLPCFDALAREFGVPYANHLKNLYFAGEMALVEFRAVGAPF